MFLCHYYSDTITVETGAELIKEKFKMMDRKLWHLAHLSLNRFGYHRATLVAIQLSVEIEFFRRISIVMVVVYRVFRPKL